MLDPAIGDFFAKRKEDWLKKNISATMNEVEQEEKQRECEALFSLVNWLPNAAKRAGQISMATHPCTFSHPSARKNPNGYVTSVIAQPEFKADGFLRSGNVAAETDALGNAAALDVHKFLTLVLNDGKTVLQHIEQQTELAQQLLTIPSATLSELTEGFLAMIATKNDNVTSSKIKQVYFPVAPEQGDYHQLSILSNSGLIYELRSRLDEMRFSDRTKAIRELRKQGEFSEQGYSDIYNLTGIGYGGTKPQNISVLNNQNGGKALLLLSVPPTLDKRKIHFPKVDFFIESLSIKAFAPLFAQFHKVLMFGMTNKITREQFQLLRDKSITDIFDEITNIVWQVREVSPQQFNEDYSALSEAQLIWLCHSYNERREEEELWLDEIMKQVFDWFIDRYYRVLDEKRIVWGPHEGEFFQEAIGTHQFDLYREVLR